MRRNPLAVLAILLALMGYAIIREVGHGVALIVTRLPVATSLRYGFLPAIGTSRVSGAFAPRSAGWTIAAGPIAAVVTGYVLLVVIARSKSRVPDFVRLLVAMASYLCLILDPTYYLVVPLLRLGGEPETMAFLLGVSLARIEFIALGLLVANLFLTRRLVVPFIRWRDASETAGGDQQQT